MFLKISQYSQENTCIGVFLFVLESSVLNRASGMKACNFIKKSLQHRCFPVSITRFLRTASLLNTSSGCSAAYPYGCSIRKLKNNFLKFSIKKILKFHWTQLRRKFFFKKLQVLHDLRRMKHYEEVVILTCSEKYRRL